MGATDIGTGSDTMFCQIAAETLGVPVDKIIPYSSDTDMTPFDPGAYASSTTYISGRAVEKAARVVLGQILEVGGRLLKAGSRRTLRQPRRQGVRARRPLRDVRAGVPARRCTRRTSSRSWRSASHMSYDSPPPVRRRVRRGRGGHRDRPRARAAGSSRRSTAARSSTRRWPRARWRAPRSSRWATRSTSGCPSTRTAACCSARSATTRSRRPRTSRSWSRSWCRPTSPTGPFGAKAIAEIPDQRPRARHRERGVPRHRRADARAAADARSRAGRAPGREGLILRGAARASVYSRSCPRRYL